jgi:hypothetical protein
MCWTGVEDLLVLDGCWCEGVKSDGGSDSVVEKDVLGLAAGDGWRSTSEVSKVMSIVFGWVILRLLSQK